MAPTDGILHALAGAAVVKLHATDRPTADWPPHSVVADRHDRDGGGGGLDEIGSIVRRTDRTSATTATDGRTASCASPVINASD